MLFIVGSAAPCLWRGAFFLNKFATSKYLATFAENKPHMTTYITAYAYAKKHKTSNQKIYARIKAGTIPVNSAGMIDETFKFVKYLKAGAKKRKK